MSDIKHIHGLQLLSATRLSITNSNTNEHSISVNGRQISYADIHLGALKLTDNKAYTLDESDGNYYEIINTNSDFTIKLEEEDNEAHRRGARCNRGRSSRQETTFSNSSRPPRSHTSAPPADWGRQTFGTVFLSPT